MPYNPDPSRTSSELASLKVTKVGLLNRKGESTGSQCRIHTVAQECSSEDLSEGGKRSSNRKWREWSVLLTGSQLLFFRDVTLALDLIMQLKSRKQETDIMIPRTSLLRPEEYISLKDALAVCDGTYTKVSPVTLEKYLSYRNCLPASKHISFYYGKWASITFTDRWRTATQRMDVSNQLCQHI